MKKVTALLPLLLLLVMSFHYIPKLLHEIIGIACLEQDGRQAADEAHLRHGSCQSAGRNICAVADGASGALCGDRIFI